MLTVSFLACKVIPVDKNNAEGIAKIQKFVQKNCADHNKLVEGENYSPDYHALVCEDATKNYKNKDGKTRGIQEKWVGVLLYKVEELFGEPEANELYINLVCTSTKRRRKGIATKLLKEADEIAHHANMPQLSLMTKDKGMAMVASIHGYTAEGKTTSELSDAEITKMNEWVKLMGKGYFLK